MARQRRHRVSPGFGIRLAAGARIENPGGQHNRQTAQADRDQSNSAAFRRVRSASAIASSAT